MPTWLQPFVPLIAVCITAFVALYIDSQRRKQVRQIELHKLDPQNVPIDPPPGFVKKFLSRYGLYLVFAWSIGTAAIFTIRDWRITGPLTRDEIHTTIFDACCLTLNLGLVFLYAVFRMKLASDRSNFIDIYDFLKKVLIAPNENEKP